jgi:adenylate kinase
VLDGCPRTVAQAEALAGLLAPMDLDLTIDIEVSTAQVLRRLAARRVCVDCGTNYSVSTPPLINWTCDVCGGEVIQREDDREEAISRRLEIYERQTAPLIEWYRERSQLAAVNGSGSPDSVTRRLVRVIEDHRDRKGGRPTR